MTKRILNTILVSALLVIFAASAFARAPYDRRDKVAERRVKTVTQYSIPGAPTRERMSIMTPDEYLDHVVTTNGPVDTRQPLGAPAASAAGSAGHTIITTYMDDAYRADSKGRQVDFRGPGSSDIHFVWNDAPSGASLSQIADNVYRPTNTPVAGFLWGASGRVLSSPAVQGRWPKVDVYTGGAVIAGVDDNGVTAQDNTIYTESGSMPPVSQAFFSTDGIATAQYTPLYQWTPAARRLVHPQVEIQEVGASLVTHILAGGDSVATGGVFGDLRRGEAIYFRRVDNGPWQDGIKIDTCAYGYTGTITASRVSSKVAVAYTKAHALGVVNNQRYDNELYYRESTNGGATWGPRTNVTNYSRVVASNAAWLETHCLYTSDDNLHIIWNASVTVDDVYNDPVYFWGDFSCSIFHWNKNTNTISRVHNAEWGIAQNTQVCGFGSPGAMYLAYFSLSECDSKLYVIFSQYLNFLGNYGQPSQIDDCASGGFSSRLYAANGEVLLCVSGDLSGLLWDAARNISNTYTPNCDSGTGGGTCMNDTRATMSRYGMLDAGMIWPGDECVDPDGGACNEPYSLHVLYTEDHFPGPGYRGAATFGMLTPNPLRWVRLSCVNPVVAAQINTSPAEIGYPSYVKPGQIATETITVRNDGNANLNVTAINKTKTTEVGVNWLNTSASTLTVNAGTSNTQTFDITITATSYSPGTLKALDGFVELVSNAANHPKDTVFITYIVADTVVDVVWDTVSTANGTVQMATGKTSLTISNHGVAGRSGLGRVNMDYVANGGAVECDTTAEVYLYDGSPLVVQKIGPGNYKFSSSIFQQNFNTDVAFRPVATGGPLKQGITADFDSVYTGHFVNFDTTVRVERTYYAPRTGGNNADFVIIKTKFTSLSGSIPNLLLGDMIDWDIPSDAGATNKAGIDGLGTTVYLRGTDTGAASPCQNKTRYGCQTFLGMYTQTEFGGNSCANDQTRYGQFSKTNDPYVFDADNGVYNPDTLWTFATALSGVSAATDSADQHVVTTYKMNYTLAAGNPLTVYTAVTTVRDGSLSDLNDNITNARAFYGAKLRPGCSGLFGCCVGTTGNVDNAGVVDIGDLTFLIDHLFISFVALPCPAEGNVDGAGVVDIGDLTYLIDHLFISFIALPACP